MSPEPVERRSQLLRGVLDMCLLSLLDEAPAYGYEVTRRLADHGLSAADGSVYPLLARLQRQGLVSTRVVASDTGPPRKYYRTTAAGRRHLRTWSIEWRITVAAVDQVLSLSQLEVS